MGYEQLTVQLLGGFSVTVGDHTTPDGRWRLKRAADLVKLLALAPRHRLPREKVVEAFWPDSDPQSAAVNVRKVAFHARRVLQLPDGIVLEEGMVRLAPNRRVSTDVQDFLAAADRALAAHDPEACRAAAAQYGGELLPDDPYAEWCSDERRRLRSVYLDVLACGQLWGRLVGEDPTNERAHREIMRVQLEGGDRTAAIRQFEQLSETLRDELGVSPDPETVSLYERILDAEGRAAPTPAERARALLAWSLVHWQRADLEETERSATEVRALAIDARLPRELTEASELLGLVAYTRGAWREVFARSFLESLTTTPDLAPFILDANMCMSEFALGEVTGIGDVARLGEEMINATGDADVTQASALGHLLRGEASLLSGNDADQARTDLVQASELHERTSSVTGWALSVARLGQLDAVEHDQRAAHDRYRSALRIAYETSVPEHLLPCIYGAMFEGAGDVEALAIITTAESGMSGLAVCDPCAMAFRIGASMACSRSGEPDRAREYLSEASRVATMWSGGPWHAAVDEAEATLQQAQGAEASTVGGLLRRAADAFDAASRPRDSTRCRASLAALR
ncbi:DNA-binding SARP family transcriptional activator [Haloactinopolyspora alba]|uniref:DNA-binding SARP family transcriptional activator n=1 Tax=Haloactinopolyspora alba TaxID=648780 RepID=A0A2P8DVS1_9ACTN|nr:BTAD domain-containing putative transcriptional regulator [Haloactinopolyspora alba]PSL01304.1 DNA-binding SARP family transcriptional activator [Haloactinopolyspora alba]